MLGLNLIHISKMGPKTRILEIMSSMAAGVKARKEPGHLQARVLNQVFRPKGPNENNTKQCLNGKWVSIIVCLFVCFITKSFLTYSFFHIHLLY